MLGGRRADEAAGDQPENHGKYVSEAAQVKYLARVEAAVVETLAECGLCSPQVAAEVARAAAQVTCARFMRSRQGPRCTCQTPDKRNPHEESR